MIDHEGKLSQVFEEEKKFGIAGKKANSVARRGWKDET